MAKLFSGYAQSRGFRPTQPSSQSRKISSRSDALLREQQRERDYIKEQAVKTDNANNARFQLEQQQDQIYQDLEVQAAAQERAVKESTYQAEIERIDFEQKERTKVFEALSGVSTTAAKILQEEIVKRKKGEMELSQSLTLQYGITAQELEELQALEGGLKDFDRQQAPIITRLRAAGASEKDINTLMQKSGWNAYGAQLGAVQNAASNYDLYLSDKYDEEVVINGVPMSLASAEINKDPSAVAGIINRHRSNFINEYLPGYDAAFISKHAKEEFFTAEARRKKGLAEQIEKDAAEANMAKDQAMTISNINENATDPSRYHDKIVDDAGGIESNVLGQSHERNHKHLLAAAKSGAVSESAIEGILNHEVYATHLGREAPYREAFPQKAAEIENALDTQKTRKREIEARVEREKTKEMQQAFSAAIDEFAEDPDSITDTNIEYLQEFFRNNYENNGGFEVAQRLERYKAQTVTSLADEDFDDYWEPQKKIGNYPSAYQIMEANLSRSKRAAELGARNKAIADGLDEDTMKDIDKEVKAVLEQKLDTAFGDASQKSLPGLTQAFNEAKRIFIDNYRFAYKGNKLDAFKAALDELSKQVNVPDPDGKGQWAGDKDDGFIKFAPTANPDPIVPTQAQVMADHQDDKTSYQRTLYVDARRMKRSISKINAGESYDFPVEIHTISRELGGKVPLSEIYLKQAEIARKENPELNIPDVSSTIKEIWKPLEEAIDPELREIVENYTSEATADRALVGSDMPPIYERSEPIISFYKLLEPYNIRPELMPIFGAVMMGESAGDPKIDTYQSGTDREMKNEYSIGLLQVNTFDHMDKLNRKGYSKDDLRNPAKNVEIAMEVWEEWIQVLMNQDPTMTREEAEVSALDRWGAYGHDSIGNKGKGPYLDHLDKARDMYRRFEAEKNKPTWEQSIHMNQYARDWIDQLEQSGGAWIG